MYVCKVNNVYNFKKNRYWVKIKIIFNIKYGKKKWFYIKVYMFEIE